MSKEKPYTPYFDEKSRWWKVKGPSQVDAGWTREDHAQRHADDLNAAFSAGAVTREEVERKAEIYDQLEAYGCDSAATWLKAVEENRVMKEAREEVSEPVAWLYKCAIGPEEGLLGFLPPTNKYWQGWDATPLYAHPPLAAKVEPRDPKEGEGEQGKEGEMPSVGGRMIDCTLGEMEQRLLMRIAEVQRNPHADSRLVATLCDAVRVVREYGDYMVPLPTPPPTPS